MLYQLLDGPYPNFIEAIVDVNKEHSFAGNVLYASSLCESPLGRRMPSLPYKTILMIGAVVDVALHSGKELVSAHGLADRLHLSRRYLESGLQALVREGILQGVRGARGGYMLAKARGAISVYDIAEAVKTIETDEPNKEYPGLLGAVVVPMLADVEAELETHLKRITVEDLVQAVPKENRPKPKRPNLVTTNFGGASSF
jgi:Rrf2 family protein